MLLDGRLQLSESINGPVTGTRKTRPSLIDASRWEIPSKVKCCTGGLFPLWEKSEGQFSVLNIPILARIKG